jgi:diguanylate cyclase (GGDEF)-like protein
MGQFFKTLSLAPKGIRHKLIVAFSLMSLIPMFVIGYLIAYYILPKIDTFWEIYLVFIITVFLMGMGFYLAKKIIYPIIEIAAHAKGIADGTFAEDLDIKEEDEIGELGVSLNRLSARLKESMSQLRSYGEQVKQINMEINKKVFALSSLLQIGNLITTGTNLTEVFDLIVGKLSQLEQEGAAFLMFLDEESGELIMRAQANIEREGVSEVKIKTGEGPLGKVFSNNKLLIIDAQKGQQLVDENLKKILQTKNIAVLPITSSGKVIAILGTGNNVANFLFTDDVIELIGVFAKQVAVAVENDILMSRTEELNLRDELTGLYNESYIRNRLDEEIKRAISYQRPCSFIIFEVNNFQRYQRVFGEIDAQKALKKIAQTLKMSTSEIDKAARFSDNQFAVLLPEKNKQQSLNLAENIKKEIERFASKKQTEPDASVSLSISVGISAVPIDGTTALELINKALNYIEQLKGRKAE